MTRTQGNQTALLSLNKGRQHLLPVHRSFSFPIFQYLQYFPYMEEHRWLLLNLLLPEWKNDGYIPGWVCTWIHRVLSFAFASSQAVGQNEFKYPYRSPLPLSSLYHYPSSTFEVPVGFFLIGKQTEDRQNCSSLMYDTASEPPSKKNILSRSTNSFPTRKQHHREFV